MVGLAGLVYSRQLLCEERRRPSNGRSTEDEQREAWAESERRESHCALRAPAWMLRLNFQARRPSAYGSVSDNVYMIPNMGFMYMQWEYLEPSTLVAHLFETVCKQCAQSQGADASCDTNTSSSSEDADV